MITLHPIESVLDDFRRGKMVILVDDEDRENEGDLLVAAECAGAEHINFMASHGRGLICLTLSEERCRQLDLPLMVSRNHARFATNFTVSIEAAHGVTTGISAQDRATTVRAAVRKDAAPDDLVTPGHIFPIKAQPGGVLTRAGHTEAGSDLARICGFEPASVICEILNPDGRMARLPDLLEFGRAHGIRIGAIADLIRYRMKNEPTVKRIASSPLQLKAGGFQSHIYRDMVEGGVHLALVHGSIDAAQPTPVRVHVHRGLLDILLQPAPPWSWPPEQVLETIASLRCGVMVVLSYDEPASDIAARITARQSTRAEAERAEQNSPANLRMLGAGGQILADLNVGKVLALGRERRAHGLSGFGLEIVAYAAGPEQLAEWLRAHA
ncbi:MAG: 3,4-dihydroxy-2-butanone-4-phosphate synthase [Gammaproteobacteria bacterium]